MTRTAGWVEPAKPHERAIGYRHVPSINRMSVGLRRYASQPQPTCNHRVDDASPSTNVPHATGHNPYPRWKTLRGFPPYGRATGPRYQP